MTDIQGIPLSPELREELRRRREALDMSQSKLAYLAKLSSPGPISRIELGNQNPTQGTLDRIVRILKIKVEPFRPAGLAK